MGVLLKEKIISSIFIVTDIGLLVASFYLAGFIRENISSELVPSYENVALDDFYFAIFITLLLLFYEKIYHFRYDFWQESLKILKACFIGFVVVMTVLALTKSNLTYSRMFLVLYFAILTIALPLSKRIIKRIVFAFDVCKKRTLLVGKKSSTEEFRQELQDNWYLGQVSCDKQYEQTIIISQGLAVSELDKYITKFLRKQNTVFVVPYISNINFAYSNIFEYSNIRQNAIEIENRLLIRWNLWVKNIFDALGVLICLPIFTILHIGIGLIIWLETRGQIFFKQQRLGQNNKTFTCYKYRTMHEDGEGVLARYLEANPQEIEHYETYHKYKFDPRITKVGRFLRLTSLDELPQIINVLKNEMSLVGPRPYMASESSKIEKDKEIILRVKPGITGLWQTSGRSHLSFKQRNELEVWYVRNWSLWVDIVILLKTVIIVFKMKGAK